MTIAQFPVAKADVGQESEKLKQFSRWIVQHYLLIIVISVLLLIPGLYGMANTKINYDILSYLPQNMNSMQGQNILEKDFRVAANAFLLVKDQPDWQVEVLKHRIEKVDGVEKVTWIDNWTDITVPKEFLPDKVYSQFYNKDTTLLQIGFKESTGSENTVQAIGQIRQILDENMYLGGTSAIIADLRQLIEHERIIYILLAILLIFIVLALTLSSFIVPVLFLLSIGAAVIYNLGSNIFLGSISYVTSAIAAVLQLGVTMDFSIFLMHRYLEEKNKTDIKFDAMSVAIQKTFVAIGASSLTAIAGFLALSVMQIGLGKDMGVVMAKGVALGVIVSLTLLPALILVFDDWISRYRHKIIMPSFKWTANLAANKPWIMVAIFILLLFPSFYGKEHVNIFYNLSEALPRSLQSIKSTDIIKQQFGSADTLYLITPVKENWKLKEATAQIKAMPGVVNVVSPSDYLDESVPEQYTSAELRNGFSNGKYEYTIIQSKYHAADLQSGKLIKSIRQTTGEYFSESYLSGESVLTDDMIKLTGPDQKAVDKWSIGAILLILLFTFGSISLPIILVLVIELAIFINLGIPYYTHTTISFVAVMTIGAIQLGSCVNYAILMVSRFKEELLTNDKYTAIKNAVQGTASSIVTSALALSCGTIGVAAISKIGMIGSLSLMIARGAFISMLAILFFLPAILVTLQGLISHTTLHWNGKNKNQGGLTGEKTV